MSHYCPDCQTWTMDPAGEVRGHPRFRCDGCRGEITLESFHHVHVCPDCGCCWDHDKRDITKQKLNGDVMADQKAHTCPDCGLFWDVYVARTLKAIKYKNFLGKEKTS